jgi:hypothetical protein
MYPPTAFEKCQLSAWTASADELTTLHPQKIDSRDFMDVPPLASVPRGDRKDRKHTSPEWEIGEFISRVVVRKILGYRLPPTSNSCANVNLANLKVSFVFQYYYHIESLTCPLEYKRCRTKVSDESHIRVSSQQISYWKEPQTPTPVTQISTMPLAISSLTIA